MKTNQHQAGKNTSRAPQRKQVRKTADANTPAAAVGNPPPAKPRRKAMGRVKLLLPKVLHDGVVKAARRLGISRSEFFRRAVAEHSGKTTDANTPASAAGIRGPQGVEAERVDRLHDIHDRLDGANTMASGFHFLMVSLVEKAAIEKVTGVEPTETDADGIMRIGWHITHQVDECVGAIRQLAAEMGSRELARARLAEMDAARAAAKGGAR